MKRTLGLLLVIALLVAMLPLTAFADDNLVNNEVINKELEDKELEDKELEDKELGEKQLEEKELEDKELGEKQLEEKQNEVVEQKITAQSTELEAGAKLSDYFPDVGFRTYIIKAVLGKGDFDEDYVLDDADITKIKDLQTIACTSITHPDIEVRSIEGIGYFESVAFINFMNKSISEIPAEISKLAQTLLQLQMRNNNLTSLPDELFECVNLQTLALTQNNISSIEGISKLTKLFSFQFSNNKVADFSELSGLPVGALETAGMGTARQMSRQIVEGQTIVVATGATSATISLSDYPFVDSFLNKEVIVYPRSIPDSLRADGYSSDREVWADNDIFPNHYMADNAANITIEFGADDEVVYLRMGSIKNIAAKPTTREWTSFINVDVTYIIPIERKSGNTDPDPGPGPGSDPNPDPDPGSSGTVIPNTPTPLAEPAVIIPEPEVPLADLPFTGGSMNSVMLMLAGFASCGSALIGYKRKND